MDPSTFAGVEATGGVNSPILAWNTTLCPKYLKSVHFAQLDDFVPIISLEAIILLFTNNLGSLPFTTEKENS